MKVTVELTTHNVGNTNVLTLGKFDTEVEGDGERFLDIMDKAVYNIEDFISLSIKRLDDARGSVPD